MNTAYRIGAILVLTSLAFVTGCGRTDQAASARSAGPKQISKWKYEPKSAVGRAMGVIVETQGEEVTSVSVYDLKDGPGFVTDSRLSADKHLVQRGAIILPIGLPPFATVEDWLANKGSHLEVIYRAGGTNVVVTIKSMGVPEHPMEFLPFRE